VETYIEQNSEATLHSLCPDCFKKYFPDLAKGSPEIRPERQRGAISFRLAGERGRCAVDHATPCRR